MSNAQIFTNNAIALLDSNITLTSTTFSVQQGFGVNFPQPQTIGGEQFFLVTLENIAAPMQREIIKCNGRSGDLFYISQNGRGWENTIPQAWLANDTIVDHRITAGTVRQLQGNFGAPSTGLSIPTTITEVANILDITGQNKTCKWIVTIQTQDGRITMTEVIAVYKPAPDVPRFTEYARVGDRIRYSISVIGTLTEMILQITNNDTSNFSQVDIIRLQHYT